MIIAANGQLFKICGRALWVMSLWLITAEIDSLTNQSAFSFFSIAPSCRYYLFPFFNSLVQEIKILFGNPFSTNLG